jgi:hypothetical protein
MPAAKRSCSPSGSQAKRCRLTERLYRIDRSGSFRECPCHFCACHSLSCWVAEFANRCSQCTRADRLCEDTVSLNESLEGDNRVPRCLAACNRNLSQLCNASIALSRNFLKLSQIIQSDLSGSTSSSVVPSPLVSPSAVSRQSSPAYSAIPASSADPVGMVSSKSRYHSF